MRGAPQRFLLFRPADTWSNMRKSLNAYYILQFRGAEESYEGK